VFAQNAVLTESNLVTVFCFSLSSIDFSETVLSFPASCIFVAYVFGSENQGYMLNTVSI
jgi:hypothetical protein